MRLELCAKAEIRQTLDLEGPASQSVLPKVVTLLSDTEYQKALKYLGPIKKEDRWRDKSDFVLVTCLPEWRNPALSFYAKKGPPLRDLATEEEIEHIEQVLLAFLEIAVTYMREDREASWKTTLLEWRQAEAFANFIEFKRKERAMAKKKKAKKPKGKRGGKRFAEPIDCPFCAKKSYTYERPFVDHLMEHLAYENDVAKKGPASPSTLKERLAEFSAFLSDVEALNNSCHTATTEAETLRKENARLTKELESIKESVRKLVT
jgi:hypothetical protein